MATNVNRTELTGNLGNDPEARFNAAGTLIVTTSIAVHSSYKQGEAWQERTDWFRLVAFGEAGEALTRFGKGERIRVAGRLQSSSYTDRKGQKRSSVELVVLHSESAPLPRRDTNEAAAPVSEAGAQRLHEVARSRPLSPRPRPSPPTRRPRSPAGAARSPRKRPQRAGRPWRAPRLVL